MDSDDYFDDDIDASVLAAVDAIEAAYTAKAAAAARPPAPQTAHKASFKPAFAPKLAPPRGNSLEPVPASLTSPPRKTTPPDVIELDGSSSDYGFDDMPMDEAALASIDRAVEIGYARYGGPPPNQPIAGPSRARGLDPVSSKTTQMNLFGEVAREGEPPKAAAPSHRTFERTRSKLRQMPLPGQTKKWDRTAYAKSGWRKPKPDPEKGKGKGRGMDDEDDEEPIEFEQFPAPAISVGPTPTIKLVPDRLAAKSWIYPLNKPKREYQYNIVKNCLLENTLVALPTGLGKTFIAGVVMLNFYNWFPQGKVIFVAPTKPLVAQQIDACHQTCGIPGSAAAEMTGSVPMAKRANAWKTQRVFYATPQTFLNDLIRGIVDPLDIVLIVIDEAHRGTGDYAYAQVVRYMMQHNPHHRILALTATPGGKPEVVQEIVDALHISHIEIRSETDPDLKKYLHTKHEQEHFVQMTEDICVLRDALSAMMVPLIKKIQGAGFLKNGNTQPTMLHPYRCQSTLGEMTKARAPQYAIGAVAQLGPLARAMGYLMEMSINMCYGFLKGIAEGADDSSGKKAIRKSDALKSLMAKFEEQAARGFSMHPKMDVLRTLLIDHFNQSSPDDADGGARASESRAMVFVSFRECVEEIVELLNKESPIIRAKPFIGQGKDKQGKKGYAQKEQLEVIEQFKAGKYNVLVSTSIGEEGLDIGEVDLIVCYDAQKTPIRMLQRIGRTGRKASGTVHILLAQGREEQNWQKAQSSYANVQHFIVRASDLKVYGDVDRLLPPDIEPECREMEMEIEPYIREERPSRKGSNATGSPKGPKRKRNDDPMHNIPTAAAKGFVGVAELLTKGSATRKKATQKPGRVDWEHADEDDSDDEDIEAGLFAQPRRVKSTSAADSSKGKMKKGLARSATAAGPRKKPPGPKKSAKQTTLTQLDLVSSDDTDDEAIDSAAPGPSQPMAPAGSFSDEPLFLSSPEREMSPLRLPSDDYEVEFVDEPHPKPSTRPSANNSVSSPRRSITTRKSDMGPPALASNLVPTSPSLSDDLPPEPSFAVRPLGKQARRGVTGDVLDLASSPLAPPPLSQRRLKYECPKSPTPPPAQPPRKKRKFKDTAEAWRHNPWIDVEATHSGDEMSVGSSQPDLDYIVPDSDDHAFLEEPAETQASPSYDQSAIYRRSLMTQAPGGGGPVFANRPARPGQAALRLDRGGTSRYRRAVTPPLRGDEDEYERDSFVVDDDAEIAYAQAPSSDL